MDGNALLLRWNAEEKRDPTLLGFETEDALVAAVTQAVEQEKTSSKNITATSTIADPASATTSADNIVPTTTAPALPPEDHAEQQHLTRVLNEIIQKTVVAPAMGRVPKTLMEWRTHLAKFIYGVQSWRWVSIYDLEERGLLTDPNEELDFTEMPDDLSRLTVSNDAWFIAALFTQIPQLGVYL